MSHLVELEAFLVVVEEGSFTAAARRLEMTTSKWTSYPAAA